FFLLLLLTPSVKSTYFNYLKFDAEFPKDMNFLGNATHQDDGIQLTINRLDRAPFNSTGQALYNKTVRLWDSTTKKVADFTTHFTFRIKRLNDLKDTADGLAFFLVPNGSSIPPESNGGCLGLFSLGSKFNSSQVNPVVAIEFDTFQNEWDPNSDHVGIDVNSINSTRFWRTDTLKNGSTANVWVTYNSSTYNLSVHLSFDNDPVNDGNSILFHILDLKDILPEWVNVGFSATTGEKYESHQILSWEFNSTDPSPEVTGTGFPSPEVPDRGGEHGNGKTKIITILVVVFGGSFVVVGVGLSLFVCYKKSNGMKDEEVTILDKSIDDDYESGTGPKRFSYSELVLATNNFSEDGKLGEGGFGGVYKGILTTSDVDVAIKRISRGSRQGKKEFVSEVKIISRLRHRNLVQLFGWCHEQGEFLLVYDYMPNGSLDFHLFGSRTMLTWVLRDIKSSNVMLDSSFNAKLGDFGLARLVDHDLGVKTTMLAGTMGYLAPECFVTGKASKKSDVYSFGVVALEIACGRRVVERKEEESKVGLVAWVWELYGSGRYLEAADTRLKMDFDEIQIERLIVVGLWCANIDYKQRPSMKQAVSVLNFETPLPDLPSKMSVANDFIPPMQIPDFSCATKISAADFRSLESIFNH
ncbi:hypothetical protein AQUCO_00200338v1, partial [Aquilegia coerulea]